MHVICVRAFLINHFSHWAPHTIHLFHIVCLHIKLFTDFFYRCEIFYSNCPRFEYVRYAYTNSHTHTHQLNAFNLDKIFEVRSREKWCATYDRVLICSICEERNNKQIQISFTVCCPHWCQCITEQIFFFFCLFFKGKQSCTQHWFISIGY